MYVTIQAVIASPAGAKQSPRRKKEIARWYSAVAKNATQKLVLAHRHATQQRWLKPAFSPIDRAQLCSEVIYRLAGTPCASFFLQAYRSAGIEFSQ